jgi:RHS repeat-associated protein
MCCALLSFRERLEELERDESMLVETSKRAHVANPAAAQLPRSPKTKAFDGVVMYYGYRFYDPETGRWPSRDPIGESGGVNLYGFVGNNGVGRVDLLGYYEISNDDWTVMINHGVVDRLPKSDLRMERISDGEISAKRYAELKKIRDELSKQSSKQMDIIGIKAALAAKSASFNGPRAGNRLMDNQKNLAKRNFPLYVEYGGSICCKDGEYKATGPFTTGGDLSFNSDRFYFYKGEKAIRFAVTDQEHEWLNTNAGKSDKVGIMNFAACPEGDKMVAMYHTHHQFGPEPSLSDRGVVARDGRPEYISGSPKNKMLVGKLTNPNGYTVGQILSGEKNTDWKIINE